MAKLTVVPVPGYGAEDVVLDATDAKRGVLAVDRDGGVEVLVGTVHGRRMRFCNNAAVHSDGRTRGRGGSFRIVTPP